MGIFDKFNFKKDNGGNMVKVIGSSEFQAEISKGVVVVDFYADWCGPCKMIAPIFSELAQEMTEVKFIKVDVDKSPDIANSYKVMSIPTIIVFKDGEEAEKIVGFKPKEGLAEIIQKVAGI